MAKVAKATARFLIVANNTLGSLVPCFYSNYGENNVINKIYNSVFCHTYIEILPSYHFFIFHKSAAGSSQE